MQINDVDVSVAVRRMWIYGRGYTTAERQNMTDLILAGKTVTYTAYDTFGEPVGQTTVTAQDYPVTLVTEVTF